MTAPIGSSPSASAPPPRPAATVTPPPPQPQRPAAAAPVITRHAPRRDESFMDKLKDLPWKIILFAAVLLFMLGTGTWWYANQGKSASPSVGGGFVSPQTSTTVPPSVAVVQPPKIDWTPAGLANVKPVEHSAVRNGVMKPVDWALIFLVLILTGALIVNIVLDYQGNVGRPGNSVWEKRGTAFQSISALIFAMGFPLAVAVTYKDGIWFSMVLVVFAVISAGAIWRAISDATPLNVEFAVLAAFLALRGITEFPQGLGNAGGLKWGPWTGFYDMNSVLALMSGFRFGESALTLVIYVLCLLAIGVGFFELVRTYDHMSALFAVVIAILAFIAGNYGATWITSLVTVDSENKLRAIQILQPLLGWLFGFFITLIASFFLKDKNPEFGGLTFKMAKVEGWQNVVNFAATLATFSIVANLFMR